jgi:hypothetical protein
MNTKLTLSLKKSIIERDKRYAKGNNQSLSQIIESYLGIFGITDIPLYIIVLELYLRINYPIFWIYCVKTE